MCIIMSAVFHSGTRIRPFHTTNIVDNLVEMCIYFVNNE
jgi:hypothetical protein